MSTLPAITALPDAPVPTDTPTDFATKAAAFVPAMNPMGQEINAFSAALEAYALSQIEAITATLSASAFGLYDGVVIGDTDGVNTEFEVLGIGFYPAWNFFIDGRKIPKDEMTINGSTVTLSSAPASGVTPEATGPRDYMSIPPDNYKAIWLTSSHNGTIALSCNSDNNEPVKWNIAGQSETESTSFSYTNDGSIIDIYCFIPDAMIGGVFDAEDCGIININIDFNITNIERIILRDNSISRADSFVGLAGLNSLDHAFYGNDLETVPLFNTANVTNFSAAFYNNNLLSIPHFDTSNVTDMNHAFIFNRLETIPKLITSNVENFRNAFRANSLITFPDLDYSSGTDFSGTWFDNDLVVDSVNLILSGLDRDGVSNTVIGLNGGTNAAPTGAGLTAITSLESRGCTVYTN